MPDDSKEHFCYLLYGLREGISVNENTKPIIFDDFNTQLNDYNCSDVTEEGLIIPTQKGENGESEADAETQKFAKVASKRELASALPSSESGDNELVDIKANPTNGLLYPFEK